MMEALVRVRLSGLSRQVGASNFIVLVLTLEMVKSVKEQVLE